MPGYLVTGVSHNVVSWYLADPGSTSNRRIPGDNGDPGYCHLCHIRNPPLTEQRPGKDQNPFHYTKL